MCSCLDKPESEARPLAGPDMVKKPRGPTRLDGKGGVVAGSAT